MIVILLVCFSFLHVIIHLSWPRRKRVGGKRKQEGGTRKEQGTRNTGGGGRWEGAERGFKRR